MQLRRTGLVSVLSALVICGAAVTFGATAADAAPAISVTPSTGLHDGQVVTVSGSGFAKSATVYIVECKVGASAIGQCAFTFTDLNTVVVAKTDASGNLHSPSPTLKTRFKTVDCTATPCEIAAHVGTVPSLTATNTAVHTISFGSTSHPSSSHTAPSTTTATHSVPAGSTSAGNQGPTTIVSTTPSTSLSTSASVAHPSATVGTSAASSTAASAAPTDASRSSSTNSQVIKKKANNNGRYLLVLIVGVLAVLFVGAMAASGRRARG